MQLRAACHPGTLRQAGAGTRSNGRVPYYLFERCKLRILASARPSSCCLDNGGWTGTEPHFVPFCLSASKINKIKGKHLCKMELKISLRKTKLGLTSVETGPLVAPWNGLAAQCPHRVPDRKCWCSQRESRCHRRLSSRKAQ